jgi:transposase-like protein
VSNTYQKKSRRAQPEPMPAEVAVPEQVIVSMGEIAGAAKEGLLALAVGTGLQVMAAMMEADVTAACGPKGRHNPERRATRHGHGAGSVTLGGRRVPVERPRIRAVDGSGEVAVPAYELFSSTEILGRMAMDRMLGGLSTRRYPVGLEPVGARTEQAATSASKSAVSRRFVAQTETALAELLAADLSGLDLVAMMVDGVHFGEHTCVVALGIGIDGTKHPLSLVEGSTENATLVGELLVGLRERGLDVTRPILVVLDGSKALRRAVLDVFDRPVLGRCQLHKIRNVGDRLPQRLRSTVAAKMRRAYHADSALAAEAELSALAAELDRTHPGAAASLREGMAETLTVLRLNLPPTLARTFRSTNAIESMISICRTHASNVKRWRDGTMALRWCAAGMAEAGKQFRRINGHLHLRSLRDTLNRITEPTGATRHNETVDAA